MIMWEEAILMIIVDSKNVRGKTSARPTMASSRPLGMSLPSYHATTHQLHNLKRRFEVVRVMMPVVLPAVRGNASYDQWDCVGGNTPWE
jgi:hypothetical protein